MNKTTGLWALNLITISTAIIISCGGSSDDGNTTTGGSSSTSGSSSGGSASGGTSSAGTTSGGTSSAGTTSTAGTAAGGTNNTGGTGNNAGGEGPGAGGEGTNPGAGGDGNAAECPATQPTDGAECTLQGFMGCDYGDVTCRCRGQQGGPGQGTRTWRCDGGNNGAGGDNGGIGDVTCPDNAETDDACTGTGQCPGQQGCVCFNNEVTCF